MTKLKLTIKALLIVVYFYNPIIYILIYFIIIYFYNDQKLSSLI